MSSGSLLGASRVGERSGGAAPGAESFARAYRLAAVVGGAAFLWGLTALIAVAFRGRVDPLSLALFAALPLAILALALLGLDALAQRRAGVFTAGCAALGVSFAFASAGHVLGPNGASVSSAFLLPGAAGWALPFAATLLAPLLAGWRGLALDLALRATGRKPRGLPLRALLAREPEELLQLPRAGWRSVASGLARAFAEGARLPGFLAVDALHALLARARPGHVERLHLDADTAALADALGDAGARVEQAGRALVVQLPEREDVVRLRRHRLAFPRGEAAWTIEIHGAREATAEARRLLETERSHAGRFAWTRQGLRWESRLNALLRDAANASSLEERSILHEEAHRIERLLDARDLMGDERSLLRGWKAQRLRILLSHKLLSEPVGPRGERAIAPAPALEPDLARVMDAGGLASLRRLVFVPHWIVPVRTAWGEQEVLVNALTHKAQADAAILHEARERGASLIVNAPRAAQFLPAPEPNASILRAVREAFPRAEADYKPGAPLELLYVPFLPGESGFVNGVTGEAAPDLGAVPALAAR